MILFSLSLSLSPFDLCIMLFLCDTLHQQLLKGGKKIYKATAWGCKSLTHFVSLFSTPCHYYCFYFPTQPVTRWQTIFTKSVCASLKAHFNNNDDNFSPPQYKMIFFSLLLFTPVINYITERIVGRVTSWACLQSTQFTRDFLLWLALCRSWRTIGE